jgi:hypothetical protein
VKTRNGQQMSDPEACERVVEFARRSAAISERERAQQPCTRARRAEAMVQNGAAPGRAEPRAQPFALR